MAKDVQDLFIELEKAIDVLGTKKLINVLKETRESAISNETEIPIIDFIIIEVCKKFSIDTESVKVKRANKIKVAMALKFICYYCKENDVSMQVITKRLHKHFNTVYTHYYSLTDIKAAGTDTSYMRYFKEFDTIFKNIKKNKKWQPARNKNQ